MSFILKHEKPIKHKTHTSTLLCSRTPCLIKKLSQRTCSIHPPGARWQPALRGWEPGDNRARQQGRAVPSALEDSQSRAFLGHVVQSKASSRNQNHSHHPLMRLHLQLAQTRTELSKISHLFCSFQLISEHSIFLYAFTT